MKRTGNDQNNDPRIYDNWYHTEENTVHRILDTRRKFIKESIINSGINISNVLDLGCGWGELFDYLSTIYFKQYPAYKFHGTGIDFCPKTITKNQDTKREYSWMLHNLENKIPEIQDETFDFIFCGETIEHLTDPQTCINEIYRLTKPGGLIIVTVPLDNKNDAPEHMHYFSRLDLIGLWGKATLINYNLYEEAQQCAAWIKY